MNDPRRTLLTVCRYALTLLVLIAVVTAATSVVACPTCKDGLAANDPNSQAMARGYFYSILFMMAMPFVIIGTFGGAAYFSIRRAREQQLAEHQDASTPSSSSQPRL